MLNKINKIITEDKNFYNKITLIDLFQSKPINKNLSKILKNFFHTLVVDEQYENFNLSTLMLKYVNLQHLNNNIIPVSLKEYIDYENDGRENILGRSDLSTKKITETIKNYL